MKSKPSNNSQISQATALLNSGRIPEATHVLRGLLAIDPQNAPAWTMLGTIGLNEGNPQTAEGLFRRALAIQKRNVDALLQLGIAQLMQGNRQDGLKSLDAAVSVKPGHLAANYNLGLALLQDSEFEKAAKCFSKVIRKDKKHAAAHLNLGIALAQLGDKKTALKHFRNACRLDPANPEAKFNFAMAQTESGQYRDAVPALEELAKAHKDASIHRGLAEALERSGQLAEAAEAYRSTIKLNPLLVEAQNNLALLQEKLGLFEESEARLDQLAKDHPEKWQQSINLAGFYLRNNRLEEAATLAHDLALKHPKNAEILFHQGVILQRSGEYKAAMPIIRKLKDLEEGFVGAIELMLEDGSHLPSLLEIEELEDRSADLNSENNELKARVKFSLGGMLEKHHQFERAYAHFEAANLIIARIQPFDFENMQEELRGILSHSWHGTKGASTGPQSDQRRVFIIGMPRSGTSLVEQVLASHSDIFGMGEMPDIPRFVEDQSARTGLAFPHCISEMNPEALTSLSDRYQLRQSSAPHSKKLLTDKTPTNFKYLGFIAQLFPGARVINVRRNPVDTCFSIFKQNFRGNQAYAFDLQAIGRTYLAYEQVMNFWRTQIDTPIHEVNYEDFVGDPEAGARDLIEFVGLDWEDGCLQFHETKRQVATASSWQVRQPIFNSSIGMWRNYEKYLTPLLESLGVST